MNISVTKIVLINCLIGSWNLVHESSGDIFVLFSIEGYS